MAQSAARGKGLRGERAKNLRPYAAWLRRA